MRRGAPTFNPIWVQNYLTVLQPPNREGMWEEKKECGTVHKSTLYVNRYKYAARTLSLHSLFPQPCGKLHETCGKRELFGTPPRDTIR